MFENILSQSASDLLTADIKSNRLPGSILFSGPQGSGKLSCALETARVLSCEQSGDWNCRCSSCLHHKAMTSQNLLLAGSSNRTLEIAAARNTLIAQNLRNSSHLEAARYLFIRSVRKLTLKFSNVLWEGEDKLSKFSPLLQKIEENLEKLQPGRVLPDGDELTGILDEIKDSCEKLESSYLYDALPVSQIRNISSWAHLSVSGKKKVLIIENADLMAESARNALLKILEEPPADMQFILTTTRRSSMLPTILSRVRTYSFFERNIQQQQNVIERVFHYIPSFDQSMPESVSSFLQQYLPVKKEDIYYYSKLFYESIADGHVPDIPLIVSSCQNFSPRVLFKIFLEGITECQVYLKKSARGCECSAAIQQALRQAYNSVSVYNENPASSLEQLTRIIMQINFLNKGTLKELQNS